MPALGNHIGLPLQITRKSRPSRTNVGLSGQQVAGIVALALGINPILDMFETMNNINGDLVCSYAVATNEALVDTSTQST